MKKIERITPFRGTAQMLPPGRDRILYVEDDDQNWLASELRLKSHYHLLRARNDREACEILRGQQDDLSAILMDIELPGSILDGIRLTMLLRGRSSGTSLPDYAIGIKPNQEIPVIFVSAYNARYSEQELIESGGNKLIPKPVDFVRLAATLIDLRIDRSVAKGA